MKDIFVDRNEKLLRIAINEDGVLDELFFQPVGEPYPGDIYSGVVKNIVPAIKSAFIDIGKDKNVYMYLDNRCRHIKLKKGQHILVQVTKEELGKKGAKVVDYITIPGKYCVLNSSQRGIEFSKKIYDSEFKQHILQNLDIPEDMGIMLRTSAPGVPVDTTQKEFNQLYNTYKQIIRKSGYFIKPGILFHDGGILGKVLRDKLQDDDFMIHVDNNYDYEKTDGFFKQYNYDSNHIELYSGTRNLFDYYNIEREILSLKNRKVYLKCGGYIVIDKTEAMYVIDVNSGRNIKGNSMERTIFTTNLQAAYEIVRQIRLRNLGGIVLIDFIDMDREKNRSRIIEVLKDGFYYDRNKTLVYGFTELNLVQIARKRFGRSIYDVIGERCPWCNGKGERLKFSYMIMLIRNEIIKTSTEASVENIHIEVGNTYKKDVERDKEQFLKDIGCEDKIIYITYADSETFKVEALVFSSQITEFEKFRLN